MTVKSIFIPVQMISVLTTEHRGGEEIIINNKKIAKHCNTDDKPWSIEEKRGNSNSTVEQCGAPPPPPLRREWSCYARAR